MTQRDNFRTVTARVLSPIGWLEGTFVVPKLHLFDDYLDKAGPFLRLHDVDLPGRKDRVQTFVVGREAVIAVAPSKPDRYTVEAPHERMVARRISCMLREGVVHGHLLSVPGVALEAYLLHHSGFVTLTDAKLLLGSGDAKALEIPLLIVNAGHVVGVSETQSVPLVKTPMGLRAERRTAPRTPGAKSAGRA